MPLSNDERGWVMTGLSGLACMLGASFICIDIIVRQFPGKRGFRIQDSDVFLSTSLSLSFGVMLFSALYSMLPSSKRSLQDGGFTSKEATWTMVACFMGGVIGIQFLSRILHHFMPSHVVECEHTHEDLEAIKEGDSDEHQHRHDHAKSSEGHDPPTRTGSLAGHASNPDLRRALHHSKTDPGEHLNNVAVIAAGTETPNGSTTPTTTAERPPLHARISASISKLAGGQKLSCDSDGPCYGFGEVCGQDCFKIVSARGGLKIGNVVALNRPATTRSATVSESTPLLQSISEEHLVRPHTQAAAEGASRVQDVGEPPDTGASSDGSGTANGDAASHVHKPHSHHPDESDQPEPHHHHVPTNAFLSIGLQTSIAIALHKLPEGFITYATNHANPKLGVSVFLALFIHNITEGFALALPLYLAINHRIKAMAVSFVLGGLSQPIGAGIAALWFKLAGQSHFAPSDAVYGGMFAVTAGIMASVALQLFSESLDLTHSKGLCMVGAFAGMAIMGISNALTA